MQVREERRVNPNLIPVKGPSRQTVHRKPRIIKVPHNEHMVQIDLIHHIEGDERIGQSRIDNGYAREL